MGTRNLTCVVVDGAYRIAQYGQWDGYPEGQGVTALKFLASMDREHFLSKVRATVFMSTEECVAEASRIGGDDAFWRAYPQMSRDHGAKILRIVNDAAPGLRLRDQSKFAGDSLFCEWAYVIDFDRNTFEVYRGFVKEPLLDGERFADMPRDGEYYPIKLLTTFDLANLPSEKDLIAASGANEEESDDVA